ncbi:hypothetical protein DPMN_033862 [Dreissena polymorpha]|uniref:CCHC-type domain-containing protein n=1 Tax=Dreissena polymorpha TaxID=45954 RepID=A0A9D4M7U0_DREPO|nr:hypothetical protein DPMN_033862 [Dreissena polymorpha]
MHLPALTGSALVDSARERTVKVKGKRGCSMMGVVNILTKNGVEDTDVEWLASGPPGSAEYDVTFANSDKCRSFLSRVSMQSSVTHSGVQYRFFKYGKQLVTCRVHWLPAFISDLAIADMFKGFGQVVSVEHDTLKVGDFVTRSGVRIVTLECDSNMTEAIPHILAFDCGSRALIAMRGRQPLCLYCQEVGHVRNTCPQNINSIFKHNQESVSGTKVVKDVAQTAPDVAQKAPSSNVKETVAERPEVTVEQSSTQKDDFQVVVSKKKKSSGQKKQISAEEVTQTEKGEEKMDAHDLEVRGEKRGRKGLITGSKRICDKDNTNSSEELSLLPQNRYTMLEVDDLEEHPLVIDLDSQDLNMTPVD